MSDTEKKTDSDRISYKDWPVKGTENFNRFMDAYAPYQARMADMTKPFPTQQEHADLITPILDLKKTLKPTDFSFAESAFVQQVLEKVEIGEGLLSMLSDAGIDPEKL